MKTYLRSISPASIALFIIITTSLIAPASALGTALQQFSQLKNAGLLMLNSKGQPLIYERANTSFIPASTTKLVTAWLALRHWGEAYRFKTHFYWDQQNKTLSVKGSGDPFLVSEELQLIASKLRQLGLQQVDTLVLDTTYFQANFSMPGAGRTNNPYDAIPSALAVNFNTVNIKKIKGKVVSAESQTPLTAYARSMSSRFKKGKLRVNTGNNPRDAEKYFSEVLIAFLRQQGIKVGNKVIGGRAPQKAPFYTHTNSKNLGEVIQTMMKYSTNFIANQLVLAISAEHFRRPANPMDVQRYMHNTLTQHFGWKRFVMKEGAGLSRDNRLTPVQLVDLLKSFKKWKHLLPEIEPRVFAKSGTLNKVSTLAGYIDDKGRLKPFALMMNQGVPYKLRNRIAKELAK